MKNIWTASSEFGTYRLCEQRRFRRACASAQSRQNLRCSPNTSSKSRGTFRQKTRSLAPLNGWACAVEICHDGMLEDTNSLDGAHLFKTIKRILPDKVLDWSIDSASFATSVFTGPPSTFCAEYKKSYLNTQHC